MITAEDIMKAIEDIETQPDMPKKLFAVSDLQEKWFKEFYPGVEVVRVPQRVGGKNE